MPKEFSLPGLGTSSDRPRPSAGIDLSKIKLTPVEGFVLSRVDGATSFGDLCAVTGLGTDATVQILKRLYDQGLIEAPGAPPRAAAVPPPRATTGFLARLDDGSVVEPFELAGAPDLPELTRARIVRLHRRLATIAPHELLGVPADADAGTVKKAYFAASKELHPDRFYGKELGPFRRLVSDIFKACTAASEALAKR